ncbi:transcription termination factor Rho, partial [Streptomyces sp. NPDC055509]
MTTTLENPPVQQQPQARTATGVLDIDAAGKGHLRAENCLPTPDDSPVSPALIRRYGLRKGDYVEGVRGDRRALTDVVRVDGREPGELRGRRHFRDLTPLHPHERLRLEHPAAGPAGRVVDLIAPVGKGQRGLLVAPPKTWLSSGSRAVRCT